MNTYLLISAIVLIALSFAWSKDSFLNWVIKIFLFGLGLCGLFYWLLQLGYIFKK